MRGRAFADVLEDALRAAAPVATSRPVARGLPCYSDPFILFSLPRFPRPGPREGTVQRGPAPPRSAPRPPARRLNPSQQRALEVLNALGAGLSVDFTAHELRRAYRRLAFRLHPDRHANCGAAERQCLSHEFGRATDSYRQLLAIAEPRL